MSKPIEGWPELIAFSGSMGTMRNRSQSLRRRRTIAIYLTVVVTIFVCVTLFMLLSSPTVM